MSDPLALVLVLVAVAVLVLTVVVWIRPLLRGPEPAPASDPSGTPMAVSRSGSPGPMAAGFGYLFSPLGQAHRRLGVGHRLDRALRRIDGVDPYDNHRRIGMALLKTQLDESGETRA